MFRQFAPMPRTSSPLVNRFIQSAGATAAVMPITPERALLAATRQVMGPIRMTGGVQHGRMRPAQRGAAARAVARAELE